MAVLSHQTSSKNARHHKLNAAFHVLLNNAISGAGVEMCRLAET